MQLYRATVRICDAGSWQIQSAMISPCFLCHLSLVFLSPSALELLKVVSREVDQNTASHNIFSK